MTKYVRLCETTNTKGSVIPWDEVDITHTVLKSPNSDWYTSLFRFDEEAFEYFKEHNSINGFKGKATLDELVFDLDSKDDVEFAQKNALTLLTRLKDEGVDIRKNTKIFFSGSKGFHIHVLLGKEFTNTEIKNVCSALSKDLGSFDGVVYNTTRLFRIPNTRHNTSKLFKIHLTPEELYTLSVEGIKDLAKNPRPYENTAVPVEDPTFVDKYIKVQKHSNKPVVVDGDIEGIRGLDEIDFSKCPKTTPRCVYALTHGIMKSGAGHRSDIFLRIAAWYKNQGQTKEAAYGALKGIARDNARLYPEKESFTAQEIWNTCIQSVYGDHSTWETRPGATGIDPENEHFKHYCEAVEKFSKEPCCLHHRHTKQNTTLTISNIENSFDNFATNFDKNIVLTGIKLIDDYMKIAIGTTTLVAGACGCHRKGEKVLMYDGSTKKVEDITVGEQLMGPDSTSRTVQYLYHGQDQMYKITPTKGESIYVNANHVLVFLDCNRNFREMTVKEYVNRYDINKPHAHCMIRSFVDFKPQETLIDPYILGVWLGDGTSSSARVTTVDPEIVESLQNYANRIDVSLKKCENKDSKAPHYALTGNNGIFVKMLSELGVYKNKNIPECYKINDTNTRLEILAGLLDTDGSLSNGCFDFIQKRRSIAEGVVFIARSLGLAAYISECEKSSQNGTTGTYYRVSISGNLDIIPTRIKRKQAKPRTINKNVLHVGFKLEKVSDHEDYYGFMLDKDHLYLDQYFNVLHNSGKTTLCLNIMENANSLNQATMFFSLDMHKNLIYLKLAQKLTPYTQDQILGFYKTRNTTKINEIKKAIDSKYGKTYFDFSSTLTIEEMRDKVLATEEKNNCKIKLVVVDYASRVSGQYSDIYANARYNALKSTEVANETEAAWIWLNQVSRNSGNGSSPLRSKRVAKDSGDWEESATNVITCWRPFMGQEGADDIIRLFLAKNRMGREIERPLKWDGARGEVKDMSTQEYIDYQTEREPIEKEMSKKTFGSN